ncbi:MAG: leucine-rich repeat domain-containing protein [Mycoplasma sp.]
MENYKESIGYINASTAIENFENKFTVKNGVVGAKYYITFPETLKNNPKTIDLQIRADKAKTQDGQIVEKTFTVELEYQDGIPPFYGTRFILTHDGVLSINPTWLDSVGYENWDGKLSIPSALLTPQGPVAITAIADDFAFLIKGKLKEIELPPIVNDIHIESIGKNAFKDCTLLKSINVSWMDELKTVGSNAFAGCSNLIGYIRLNEKVVFVGKDAFNGCGSLPTIHIPFAVENLNNGWDNGWEGEVVNYQKTWTEGMWTLDYQRMISIDKNWLDNEGRFWDGNLTFPATVDGQTVKGVAASFSLNKLEDKVKSVAFASDSKIESINNDAFRGCRELAGTIEFPETLRYINRYAFADTRITSFTLQEGITYIADEAFAYNPSLTGTITLPKSLVDLKDGIFRDCSDANLKIQTSTTEQYESWESWSGFKEGQQGQILPPLESVKNKYYL